MPKSLRMRSRRSRKGGFSMNDLNPFGSSSPTNNGYSASTQGNSSWSDWLTGKKDQSTGYGTGLSGMGTSGMGSQGYGSMGSQGYGSMGTQGYGSMGTQGYGSMGGKRRRRGMRGGSVSPNMSLTDLASSAAPISGGRTRRRRHRHTKSCKKSCKKR
jgi:hypothetical protein